MVWHPILAAVEHDPGVWTMTAQYGRVYGTIRYDAARYTAVDGRDEPVGEYVTLRGAVEALHKRYLRGHGREGFAPAPWPE